MIVYSILLITLLIGAASVGLLLRPWHWSRILLGVLLAVFIHLYGAWIFISFYTKYVFDLVAFCALFNAFIRRGKTGNPARPKPWINLSLSVLMTLLILLFFTGLQSNPPKASLHFPFKNGRYLVFQGGRGLPANFFHGASPHSIYAMDIIKLNDAGQRCKHIFSKKLDDYFIFADTIYSPCDGIVQRAIDDNPDNIPPIHVRGVHNLNGVVVESADYTVFLGHMKEHCVFVKAGDAVKTGTPLGLAGNSGKSIEPHLHIQVHEKSGEGQPWYQQRPMIVTFEGKEYRLFEMIKIVP